MQLEHYLLLAGDKIVTFEFVSEGPRGRIKKIIQFTFVREGNNFVYNLAFGNKNSETGELDDFAVSDNGDTEKILATVVYAVYLFMQQHPGIWIYATGSTEARTRLYRMGISKYYDISQSTLHIFGQTEEGDWLPFQKNTYYRAFLVHEKD